MTPQRERTPTQWFEAAAQWYMEGHQACPWCAGSHRVFRSERHGRTDYYCHSCDFYVSYEAGVGYHVVLGQDGISPPAEPAFGCI